MERLRQASHRADGPVLKWLRMRAGALCLRTGPAQLGPAAVAVLLAFPGLAQGAGKRAKVFVNSIGMRMVRIEAGRFEMGKEEGLLSAALGPVNDEGRFYNDQYPLEGDFDEKPAHKVRITKPFYIGETEVTNALYEQFDPGHRMLRGKRNYSTGDQEAVVFVSWYDAVRFCKWLSRKEKKPYRLPTEAEWEYACRAGTKTAYSTGDTLPDEYLKLNRIHKWSGPGWKPDGKRRGFEVDLTVGLTPPNPWGLYDMHGNVEEWCYDWYGPYAPEAQTDPVGRAEGDFRVSRGGSHSTALFYLRSSNRMGTLPEDKSWLIGFRVVQGEMPATQPLPVTRPPLNQQAVNQKAPPDLTKGPDPRRPYFEGPVPFVIIPPGSHGPLWSKHNHSPKIVQLRNGDLLAIWFTCIDEPGREHRIAASRKRFGQDHWEPASPFWGAPDRNSHDSTLWVDEKGKIFHFNGLGVAETWSAQALLMRTSADNGATWTRARLIDSEHGPSPGDPSNRMPITSNFRAADGTLVVPSDARGNTVLYLSRDEGATWRKPEGVIAGIHAGVVQLRDGRLLAIGRGHNVAGQMPISLSSDMGKTWTISASPFPGISSGQRIALTRLQSGAILLASFCGDTTTFDDSRRLPRNNGDPIEVIDAAGVKRKINGLFVTLSFDDGKTWPTRRLVTAGGPPRQLDLTYGTRFVMDENHGEPQGYLAVCQTANGLIHLITSQREYIFNMAWLKTPMPAAQRASLVPSRGRMLAGNPAPAPDRL